MSFDWDHGKSLLNRKKHHVSFELAITAFDDPFALIAPDSRHSIGEVREWLIGESDDGVLVVVYTVREQGVVRLISARRATRKERNDYEYYKAISI